jgi:hypothetical protein
VCEHPYHGLVVFVEEEPPSLQLREKGVDRAPDGLEPLEDNMLELAGTRPKAQGLYEVLEDCPPSETVGVAMKVGGLDGLKDGGAVVRLGHLSTPL